jgi:hypothetical protein
VSRALSLDDPRWQSLVGGYRIPYDPRPALRRLAADFGDEGAWDELWGELHHQGDLGDASYVALPSLVDFGEKAAERGASFYALAATIEVERHRHSNPELPAWLAPLYAEAWEALVQLALSDLAATSDPFVVQSALAVVALGKGALRLGALVAHLDASEIEEYLDEHAAWSELYDERKRLQRGG